MTVKEFYEWCVEKGIENYILTIETDIGSEPVRPLYIGIDDFDCVVEL